MNNFSSLGLGARPRAVNRLSTGLAVLAAAAILGACATSGSGQPSSLEKRAQARWDALLARDIDAAYGYLSPGYRSSVSRVDYEISLRTHRVVWTSAEVRESDCDGDACSVQTKVGYRIGSPLPGVPKWESFSVLNERWVRTDGQWWFVPE